MNKVDNDRLLKALLISICFHGLLFLGMNMFDWFPETDNTDQYGTISVMLQKPVYSVDKKDNLKDQISEKKITESENPSPMPPVTTKKEDIGIKTPAVEDTAYDPYADIGESSDTVVADTPVETPGNIDQDTAYVPVARDSIEFEVPVKGESGSVSSNQDTNDETKKTNSVISSGDMSELENALNSDNNNNLSPSSKSDETVYQYNASPVDFDTKGVNRKLIASPYPKLPTVLPADFPSEITYKIRFSLNTDGLIKVLSITPSSVYPEVDTSIRNALRSWTFNQSAGTEDVKGTITLIFKGR